MTKKLRFYFLMIKALFFSLLSQAQAIKEPQKNVIFILADDLGYHDLSCMGSQYYETPHIDKIAEGGTIFKQGYATSAVCSPSRASIMTGKFTARHGITDWIGAKTGKDWSALNRHTKLLPPEYKNHLEPDDITLAEALKEAGYTTFFAGKWHLGSKGSHPENHGFDFNVGGWQAGSPIGGYFSPYNNPKLENKKNGENLSRRLAKETSNFIRKNQKKPFFAFLSFYAVHGPIQTTKAKWKKYRDKAEQMGIAAKGYKMERRLPIRQVQDNPVYAGLVEAMDDAVGEVMNTLKELGLDQNTMVIFTSDNGGVASGDSFSTANVPLKGGKGYQWEGGIREPFFIKIPWLNSVKSTKEPVTGADFYPTILEALGLDPKAYQHRDGESLIPVLKGGKLKERPLYWHYPHYGNQGGDPNSTIRKGQWKLIHYWENGANELYNLKEDPEEQKNLIKKEPKTAKKLWKQLDKWLKSVQAQKPSPDPIYDEKLEKERLDKMIKELLPQKEKERSNYLDKHYQPNKDWWGSQIE